jgi:hypothetical protein
MNFMPPHDQAREREAIKRAVLASFPAEWCEAIRWVNVSDSQCCIELWAPISVEAARKIAETLAQAFEGCDVVINGLSLWEGDDLWKYPGMPWTTTQETIDWVAKLIGG